MTTVAEFATSNYTFTATDSVRFDIDTATGEQALVTVRSGSSNGAIIFQMVVTTTAIYGPFNAGDYLTVYAKRGSVDYTIVNQEATHPLSDSEVSELQSRINRDGWIPDTLRKLIANTPKYISSNPAINGVSGSPPTITIDAVNDATLTNIYEWNDTTKRNSILWCGGEVGITQTVYRQFPCTTVSGASATNAWRITFVADCQKLQIPVWHRFTTSTFRLVVNGQYVSTSINDPTANNAARYIHVDFGSRGTREISLEGESAAGVRGVYVTMSDTIWVPTNREIITAYVVGDSYSDGADAPRKWDGFSRQLGHFMGWDDIRQDAIGGTGYINVGTGQTRFVDPVRIGYVQRAAPKAIVIAGGYNDRTNGYAAIYASVVEYYNALRANSGTATSALFFVGPWTGVGADADLTTTESAISDAVASFNDNLAFFIPQQSDSSGRWFSGTGYESAPNGTGNKDIYGSSTSTPLGVHVNTAGHLIISRRLSAAIYKAVSDRILAL